MKSTPECFELHCIIDRETHDLIEYARSLSHRRQDIPQVLKHALELAVAQLEKEKFGASSSPRVTHATSRRASPRYIPAAVKLAVWKRDEGHCTFVGTNGERCGSQHRLEYDHILPVARGGQSTADNLRLRCRPHNQLEAELVYGTDFMRQKRKPA